MKAKQVVKAGLTDNLYHSSMTILKRHRMWHRVTQSCHLACFREHLAKSNGKADQTWIWSLASISLPMWRLTLSRPKQKIYFVTRRWPVRLKMPIKVIFPCSQSACGSACGWSKASSRCSTDSKLNFRSWISTRRLRRRQPSTRITLTFCSNN